MTRYSSLSLTEIVCLCADEGGDEGMARVRFPCWHADQASQ